MANRTLSDLPVTTVPAGTDILHNRQSLTDKSISLSLISQFALTGSDYAPIVESVTGTSHVISSTVRKRVLIADISSNCTLTFPGTYGDGVEIIVQNLSSSTANVIGLPSGDILYPGQEIVFIWDGSSFVKRTFTNSIITGIAAPTITPDFIGQYFVDTSNKQLYFATGTSSSTDWENTRDEGVLVETKTSDYTITTSDINKMIVANPNTVSQYGLLTIELPLGSSTIIGRRYKVKHGSNQGLIKIIVNSGGSDKIIFKGNQINYVLLYAIGDTWDFIWDGTNWLVEGSTILKTNYRNRSDWTNVHIGNGVTYDTKSAAVDLTGMVITESTSGYTAIVVYDSGGTGTSGVLYVYGLSSGFTYFTDGYTLTASDGTTALVNEASGISKNVDYNFYHGFGVNISEITPNWYFSTDGSENNSYLQVFTNRNPDYGSTLQQVSENIAKIQVGGNGIVYINDSGTAVVITTSDYYEKAQIEFKQ